MKWSDFDMFSRRLVRASALVGGIAVSGAFGQAPPLPRIDAGDMVNVEVKIVPFYAVDAQGKPVYDLRKEEVELRVGGAPVPLESFDSYAIAAEKAGARSSPLTPAPSRTVFLLFDTTFSSPIGFKTDKRLAARMVEGWPTGDRLFLITHGTRAGLEKKLGPVPPDAKGKEELLAAIEALQPEIRRVETQDDPTIDYSPPAGRAALKNPGGAPEHQMAHNFDSIQGAVHGEYHSIARDLAASLQGFAGELRRVSGPKLLVIFSQGMHDTLYFEGDNGNRVGSDENIRVDTRRAPPLADRFREPLLALADAGAISVFVNTDRDTQFDGDAALRHMAKTTGGLYLEGKDPRNLETRFAASTAAYYEAGFHPLERMLQAERAGVEIVVRRPGVKAWAPSSVRMRESYRSLSAFEKRRLVIDLVAGGPGAQRAHASVPLKLQDLGGKVVGQAASGSSRLQFKAEWPASLAARRLDLYNVMLVPPLEGRKGRILAFDEREVTAGSGESGVLEAVLTEKGAQVWGIVAVDPETEQVWMRRLVLQAPERVEK
jgi:VWFA-related protein